MQRLNWISLACSIALLAGSCGGEDDAGADGRTNDLSALEELRPVLLQTDEERAAASVDFDREVGERVRECVAEEGFEYRVPIPDTSAAPSPSQANIDGLSDEQFAAQYGFGWSTTIDRDPLAVVPIDPNDEYRQTLTPAAQAAYESTLATCQEQAYAAVEPPPGAQVSDDAVALYEDVQQRIETDERYVAAVDGWRECMSEHGVAAESPSAMYGLIGQRVQPFLTIFDEARNALLAANRRAEVADLRLDPMLTPAQRDELSELQQDEIAYAVANVDCGGALEAEREEARARVVDELVGE